MNNETTDQTQRRHYRPEGAMLNALLGWLKPRACSHRFAIEDLGKTGIPELAKPAVNEYQAWVKYYAERDERDSHTKRVTWPCAECGKVFYAHCGLDIAPEHGPMFRRDPVPNTGINARPEGAGTGDELSASR